MIPKVIEEVLEFLDRVSGSAEDVPGVIVFH